MAHPPRCHRLTKTGIKRQDFTIPFSLAGVPEASRFVARESELEEIHRALGGDGKRCTIVLRGLGGIGKTQMAVEYAKRFRDNYSAMFWLNTNDETSLKNSLAEAAKRILQHHPSADQLRDIDLSGNINRVVDAVNAWLSQSDNTRWLAIYDNYDNPKVRGNTDSAAVDIRRFLPNASQGSVIITTRSSQVRIGYDLPVMKLKDVHESVEILSSMSRRTLSLKGGHPCTYNGMVLTRSRS